MDDESHDDGAQEGLASREPSVEDVVQICRELDARGARYIVVGGFAIRQADYSRTTMDIDLLVDPDLGNEAKVFDALATLPDGAVRELDGVKIPFANSDFLWRMKSRSMRPKDQGDLFFLREWFAAEGRQAPQ